MVEFLCGHPVHGVGQVAVKVLGGGSSREIEGVGKLTQFAREYVVVVARVEGEFRGGGTGGEDLHVRFGDVVVGRGFDPELVLVLEGGG